MTIRPRPLTTLSTDQLWILVILVTLLILGCARALPPNDLWWHARVGDEILNTGHIPRTDVYSLTEHGQPFFYQSWLAEVWMALILRLGGVRLLVLVRALISTAMFGGVLWLCWRAGGGDRRAALPPALIAIVLGLGNQTVRPQLFAYPLFVGVYALLRRHRRVQSDRAIWLIPVLMTVWVNVHGSFALGLGLVWLFTGGEILSRAMPAWAGGKSVAHAKTLLAVAVLSTGALFVNPRGVEIIAYVSDLLTDAPSQSLGAEWQPPDPKAGLGKSFYAAMLWGVVMLALARPALPLTDLLLFAGFAWLGAAGVRYVVWFGVVGMPIVATAMSRVPWADLARWRDRLARTVVGGRFIYGDGTGYPGFRRLALAALAAVSLAIAPLFLFYPVETLWVDQATGVDAVDFMERRGLVGQRLFNELGRGSYLIWRFGPAQPVFIDPRFELYALEHFEDYLKLSKAEAGFEALLTRYDFDVLLLDAASQARLVEWLNARPEQWQRLFSDEVTLLYQRVEK